MSGLRDLPNQGRKSATLSDLRSRNISNGLDPSVLELHQRRVLESISNPDHFFPIDETCTLKNRGILALSSLKAAAIDYRDSGVVGLVPAAGAASRYVAPLEKVSAAFKANDMVQMTQELSQLRSAGALKWAIPDLLRGFLGDDSRLRKLSESERIAISSLSETPKALFPCTAEQTTFLEFKHQEHVAIAGLKAQVFISPKGASGEFSKLLSAHVEKSGLKTLFEEQDGLLSTLRFRKDGSPFLNSDGEPSLVPAGHGALTRLFETIREKVDGASSLLIRNVDNVNGTSAEVVAATQNFLCAHAGLLKIVKEIRSALAAENYVAAAHATKPLRGCIDLESTPGLDSIAILWKVMSELFHTNREDIENASSEHQALSWAYGRPLNLLGQVANTGKDVGGTPVFIAQGRVSTSKILSQTRKLCIEVPHASGSDAERFLKNPSKATHFNPVFIAAEIPADPNWYDGAFDFLLGKEEVEEAKSSHPFWLVAQKTYRDEPVYYHESLLSEVMGNSYMTNFVFVEIPRSLFNPHKTLADSAGRNDRDWV